MAPPISEGQSNTSSAGSESAVDTAEDEVWYDCEAEEWCEVEDEHSSSGITDDATQQSSPITATADESGLTQEQLSCLRALPARLSALLTKYLQVKPQPWLEMHITQHAYAVGCASGLCVCLCLLPCCQSWRIVGEYVL